MSSHVEQKKKTSVVLDNSSSRAIDTSQSGVCQVRGSASHLCGAPPQSQPRPSSIVLGGSNIKLRRPDRSAIHTARKAARVMDSVGKEITPLTLYHLEPRHVLSKPARFFLEEIFYSSESKNWKSTSSFTAHSSRDKVSSCTQADLESNLMCGVSSHIRSFPSSQLSSLSKNESLIKETEDSAPGLEIPLNPQAPYDEPKKSDVEQCVTEEMLDEESDICLTDTDTISLLDVPSSIFVSEDADNVKAIKERNLKYAELCKNRMGNDKYVARSAQTFSREPKNKDIQSDEVAMVDKGMTATTWDISDSLCGRNKRPECEEADDPERTVTPSKGQERREEKSSSCSNATATDSTSGSLLELEMCGITEPDVQLLSSESLKLSLLVMERIVLGNIFQPELAAYRHLPILEDPDITAKPGAEEQCKEDEESSSSPTMERLWVFSCKLTRRRNITSMAWNKMKPDILAVGYGDCDPNKRKPGLICCWSLKNPVWPESVFHCPDSVTCLDFSANNPNQLAVGMFDGTVAIYNVRSGNNSACISNSSQCLKRHLRPVWQVTWIIDNLSFRREAENLISVSADGRITKWFLCSYGLDCIDVMQLKSSQNTKKKAAGTSKKEASVLLAMSPGLCVDFHPTDSGIYLAGTWEGPIHKSSISSCMHVLDTYQQHTGPVNHIKWSPFISDVFLSCSSDCTIQLWRQNRFTSVLSFTSTQEAVYTIKWSPKWPTIFAAISGRQVEIWDMISNMVDPIIVYHAEPGVKPRSLVFDSETDCVLVGDSAGQVTVYQLKNLSVEGSKEVDSLEEIIQSAMSK